MKNRGLKDKRRKFLITIRKITKRVKQIHIKGVKRNQETGTEGNGESRINSVNKISTIDHSDYGPEGIRTKHI